MATGEIGGTPRHYKAGKAAYGWKCPNCGQEQMGRVEYGCQNCSAGRDAQFKARPNPRDTSSAGHARRLAAQKLAAATERRSGSTPLYGRPLDENGTVEFSASTNPDPFVRSLVDAALLVLLRVHPETDMEVEALLALENAVGKFTSAGIPSALRARRPAMTLAAEPEPAEPWQPPEEAVKLNDQLLDPRTILTLAAALDYFADQVLMTVDPASSEFLSEDHARALSQQLRQTLPPNLASLLEPPAESDGSEETEE